LKGTSVRRGTTGNASAPTGPLDGTPAPIAHALCMGSPLLRGPLSRSVRGISPARPGIRAFGFWAAGSGTHGPAQGLAFRRDVEVLQHPAGRPVLDLELRRAVRSDAENKHGPLCFRADPDPEGPVALPMDARLHGGLQARLEVERPIGEQVD